MLTNAKLVKIFTCVVIRSNMNGKHFFIVRFGTIYHHGLVRGTTVGRPILPIRWSIIPHMYDI